MDKKELIMNKYKIILALMIMYSSFSAQDLTNSHKISNSLIFVEKINKKSIISFGTTAIGELSSFQFEYFQSNLSYKRELGKRISIEPAIGLILIKEPAILDFNTYLYGSVAIDYDHRFIKEMNVTHTIEAEYFLPKFNKFGQRYTYEIELETKKSWTDLKIAPFTRFKIYYYHGGNYLNYYDTEGELVARKAPNDIHRWRWHFGFKFKPMRKWTIKCAYFWNEEFNAGFFPNSEINIYNKNKNGIRMPFNSYGAVNLTLIHSVNLINKKNKSNSAVLNH